MRAVDSAPGRQLWTTVEFSPGHGHVEQQLVHVLWLTSGLGCDGDSVAMTAATSPSLEDLLHGVIPGMPRLALYNPLLAYESGEDFMSAFWRAAQGALDPFLLVLEPRSPVSRASTASEPTRSPPTRRWPEGLPQADTVSSRSSKTRS